MHRGRKDVGFLCPEVSVDAAGTVGRLSGLIGLD